MQIAHLRIKEFGGWSELELASFGDGLNVLYSPHGLDTSAVAQFVRSVLFGYDENYRQRFSPSSNVRWGGTLEMVSGDDSLIVQRFDDGSTLGHLSVNGRHNRSNSQQVLNDALCGIDVNTFSHAFVMGLRVRPSIERLVDCALHHGLVDQTQPVPEAAQKLQTQLDNLRTQLATLPTISADVNSLQAQRKALAEQIQKHKQPQLTPTKQPTTETDSQLKRWGVVLEEIQQHREQLRAEIDQLNVDHATAKAKGLTESQTQLRREVCANQLRQLTRCYTELRHTIHDLVKRGYETGDAPAAAAVDVSPQIAELKKIDRQIQLVQQRDQLRAQIETIEREINSHSDTTGLLDDASANLGRLTCDQWQELQIIDRRVVVKDAHGVHTDYQHLTDSARDQVYLSLALAVANVFAKRGVRLPIVIDDVCLRAGSAWTTATVELLQEFGANGQQIVVLISQNDVAQMFQLGQAFVCQLPRGTGKAMAFDHNAPSAPVHRRQASATRHESGLLSYLYDNQDVAEATSRETSDDTRFCLSESNPIDDAPSMDFDSARALRQIGVHRIGDLLRLIPTDAGAKLEYAMIASQKIRRWQAECLLACRVPHLSLFDAQVLVACGIRDPEVLGSMRPNDLYQRVTSLAETNQWQALIENGNSYEIERLRTWINNADRWQTEGSVPVSAPTASANQN